MQKKSVSEKISVQEKLREKRVLNVFYFFLGTDVSLTTTCIQTRAYSITGIFSPPLLLRMDMGKHISCAKEDFLSLILYRKKCR